MCIVKMQTAHAPIYTLCQSAWVFESRDASPASISLWPCLWVLSLWGHLSTEVISQLVLPEWVHWLYSKSMQHESHVKWPTDTQCGLLSSEWLWWEPFREVGTRTLIKHWLGPWWKWSCQDGQHQRIPKGPGRLINNKPTENERKGEKLRH